MVTRKAVIAGSGFAFPMPSTQTELWDGFFRNHFSDSPIARRLFNSCGVTTRQAAANPLVEDLSDWSTEQRLHRFLPEAMPLGIDAVGRALKTSGIEAADVGLFATVSCTGYATPGLDSLIAAEVGMADSVQRLAIGHVGCHAALPGLGVVSDFAVARGRAALLLCIELPSLHVQPPTSDVEQMVAHSLFGDAAAAVVVTPQDSTKPGVEIVDICARMDADTASLMTWTVTDLGFRMGLSSKIPDVLAIHVRSVVEELLLRNDLKIEDVDGWAVHPGGPRILDVTSQQLDLSADDMAASRAVLARHGNCSSATVLMVLSELLDGWRDGSGRHVVALAFGPGLTFYAVLLRVL